MDRGKLASTDAHTWQKKRLNKGEVGSLDRDPAAQPPKCPRGRPPCPLCGGYPIKHEKRKNGIQRYLCPKCNIRFQDEYKDIRKEGNPNWKGDNITKYTGNDRAHRWYPVPSGYERHHIDGNPKNNDPSNIKIVTRKEHMLEDGRLEKLRVLNAKKRRVSS